MTEASEKPELEVNFQPARERDNFGGCLGRFLGRYLRRGLGRFLRRFLDRDFGRCLGHFYRREFQRINRARVRGV